MEPMLDNSVDIWTVQEYAADVVYDMCSISVHFGLIMGLHFFTGSLISTILNPPIKKGIPAILPAGIPLKFRRR